MADVCIHLGQFGSVVPGSDGCEECPASGSRWVHLRAPGWRY